MPVLDDCILTCGEESAVAWNTSGHYSECVWCMCCLHRGHVGMGHVGLGLHAWCKLLPPIPLHHTW